MGPKIGIASLRGAALVIGTLAAFACGDDAAPPRGRARDAGVAAPVSGGLPDEAAARGLDYVNASGEAAKATILEANGAGVALLDLERDGDLDVVFAQGLDSLAQLMTGPGADLIVYLNDGTGHFTKGPAPGLSGWWTGLAAGDVDGDGDADLVAGGFGGLVLLLQNESGALEPARSLMPPVTEAPDARLTPGATRAPGHPPLWVTSLALFDADRDGQLDLYVGQYLELDPVDPPLGELGEGELAIPCRWKGLPVYCGPRGLVAQPDRLLRGIGAGRFEDVTEAWLPDLAPGFTLAVGAFDADGDGDTDLVVANDSSANLLLVNDGTGKFVELGYSAGIAFSSDGRPEAGMGVAFGDVNRDGRPDFVVTNFSGEPTQLYFGAPVGFAHETFRYGLANQSRRLLSWSVHLADFDGDSWLELFTANGHVYPQADGEHTGTRYGQRDTLWRLGPAAKAVPVLPLDERSILAGATGTRGTALGDVNGDGAPDLVLVRIDAPCALGLNRMRGGHRLAVRCLGPTVPTAGPYHTPADGMGTRVAVVVRDATGELGLLGEVQTSVGFQSSSSPWLHFGLGASARYSGLRIFWPSGRTEDLPGGLGDRRLVIREGDGIVAAEELP
ncbi:MAG: CRTAC1 family protein [Planctomycetota bacterium]|nr:MAG: CRTAC1 family protein [Planctomycetota bacterium]